MDYSIPLRTAATQSIYLYTHCTVPTGSRPSWSFQRNAAPPPLRSHRTRWYLCMNAFSIAEPPISGKGYPPPPPPSRVLVTIGNYNPPPPPPHSGLSREIFPRLLPQNTPFPEKMGIRMRPHHAFEWGRDCNEVPCVVVGAVVVTTGVVAAVVVPLGGKTVTTSALTTTAKINKVCETVSETGDIIEFMNLLK